MANKYQKKEDLQCRTSSDEGGDAGVRDGNGRNAKLRNDSN